MARTGYVGISKREGVAPVNALSATLEDYLGIVLEFQREKRFARVSDISSTLGVAKSAVTVALQSLSAKGMLNYQPYEPVTLTREGQNRAEAILLRRRIILSFLQDVLAIEPRQAESITCKMEHAIAPPALEKFVGFLVFIGARSGRRKTWLNEFQSFTRNGIEGRTCRECVRQYLRKTRADVCNGQEWRSLAETEGPK